MRLEHIIRTIGYLFLYAVNLVLYLFLHSHFHFIVLVLMTIAPVLSIVSLLVLKRYITVELNVASGREQYGRQRDEAYFLLKIGNKSLFVSLDTKIKLEIGNSFFGTKGVQQLSVPIHMKSGYEVELPVIATLPGILYMEVQEIRIKDMMGFFSVKKSLDVHTELSVMPQSLQEVSYEKTAIEQGMLESEESSKRGNDFSDVQEIREYIPGDKLMSIHWKLSAKRDILMVKDRVSMSDRQLVVLPELCNVDITGLNAILGSTYSLIQQLIQDKTTVRLMYWSISRYEYEDLRIDYQDELDQAFVKMYYETCYGNMDEAASHMALVHPEMKAYLHVSADKNGVNIRVRENI